LRGDNVTPDFAQRRLEFLLEFFAAHHLSGLSDLAQQFFQAPEETDQAAFVDICHFAVKRDMLVIVSNGRTSQGFVGK
jgi:hypothetical protein